MILPTNVLLKHTESILCPDLLTTGLYSRICKTVGLLPHFTHLGFECHLGKTAPKRAGLFFCFNKHEWSSRVFSGKEKETPFPENFRSIPKWQTVRKFFSEWEGNSSPLSKNFPNTYFEFDIYNKNSEIPIPSIFFNLAFFEKDKTHTGVAAMLEGLLLLSDNQIPDRLIQKAMGIIERLPSPDRLYAAGLMLSRPAEGIRLCISGLSLRQFIDYLGRIEYCDGLPSIKRILANLDSCIETYILHIDILNNKNVSPRLGLECFPTRNRAPSVTANWKRLLNSLVQMDLCRLSQKECLEAWPKLCSVSSIAEILIFRRLNHVKLVFNDNNLSETKVYTSIAQEWA
jgi:hypothetical protein